MTSGQEAKRLATCRGDWWGPFGAWLRRPSRGLLLLQEGGEKAPPALGFPQVVREAYLSGHLALSTPAASGELLHGVHGSDPLLLELIQIDWTVAPEATKRLTWMGQLSLEARIGAKLLPLVCAVALATDLPGDISAMITFDLSTYPHGYSPPLLYGKVYHQENTLSSSYCLYYRYFTIAGSYVKLRVAYSGLESVCWLLKKIRGASLELVRVGRRDGEENAPSQAARDACVCRQTDFR